MAKCASHQQLRTKYLPEHGSTKQGLVATVWLALQQIWGRFLRRDEETAARLGVKGEKKHRGKCVDLYI